MFNGYNFFRIYHSLNLHFSSNYDVLKYGDKGRPFAYEMFEKRRDKLIFESFANKLQNQKTAFEFCIANFVHNKDNWLYDEYSTADSIYREWVKYFDSYAHMFKTEYKVLDVVIHDKQIPFKKMLEKTKSGNMPPLLQLLLHGKLSPEFICSLDRYFNFLDGWYDMYVGIDPFVENKLFVLKKYKPLCSLISKERSKKSEQR